MKWLLLFILPIEVLAAGGGHSDGIPFGKLIIPQLVNVIFFFGLLIYFTRGLIVDYFKSKNEDFHAAEIAAAKAKEEAANKHATIKSKIQNLSATADAEKAKAITSAEELKVRLIENAKLQAEKLQKDAEITASAELQRAIMTLRTETISKASEVAKAEMDKNSDNSKLQKAFVSRVQGASL